MGRELRMVTAAWEHPRDAQGKYIPMFEHFLYNSEEIREGLRDGWLKGGPPNYGMNIMPCWPDKERTHFQMYETCTEGTPISPVMESPEKLAHWLANNGASAFAGMAATYEQWLAMIKKGHSVSMVIIHNQTKSGVEAGI